MKKIFTIAALCFGTISLHAQTATIAKTTTKESTKNLSAVETPAAKPVDDVLALQETAYDFGKIPQGKPVTHVFNVLNNGKDSLKIIKKQFNICY